MISPHLAERVLLRGSDGGFYYATQFAEASGSGQLWWYGEHASLAFANVYFASFEPEWGEAGRFRGHLVDVPKGRTCADFLMDLAIVPAAAGRPTRLEQIDGPRSWEVVTPDAANIAEFTRPAGPIPPTFDGQNFDNMTGLYRGDDGGDYYVFEHPSAGRMYWVGVHPEAEPGPTGARGRRFANVFRSNLPREWTYASGDYVDVPRGGTAARGSLVLEMFNEDPQRIRVAFASRGFGLRELRRTGTLSVSIDFRSLTILDQHDSWPWLEGDEPMLDVAVVRMDGESVDVNALERATAVIDAQATPVLASEVREGTTLRSLGLRNFSALLRPVPGDDGTRPVLGVFVGAWDRDFSPSGDRGDLFAAWRSIFQFNLDRALRAGGRLDFHELAGTRLTRFRWFSDDFLGYATVVFTWADLQVIARGTGSSLMSFSINPGGDGNYRVRATLDAADRLVDSCTAAVRRR